MKLSNQTFLISMTAITVFGITAILALFLYLNPETLKRKNFNLADYIPVTKAPTKLNLELNSPEDELLVFENTILVSGKTAPVATVILRNISPEGITKNTSALVTNAGGEFSKVVNLSVGLNIIEVTSFGQDDDSKSETRFVYYSEEKL